MFITSVYSDGDLKRTATFEQINFEQLANGTRYDYSGADLKDVKMAYVVLRADEADLSNVDGIGVVLSSSKDGDNYTLNTATNLGTRNYKISSSLYDTSEIKIGAFIQYKAQGNTINKITVTNPELTDEGNTMFIKAKVINIYDDAINLRLPDESRVLYYANNVIYVDGTEVAYFNADANLVFEDIKYFSVGVPAVNCELDANRSAFFPVI